ncbi:MAG: zinc ribbon domain-containing protein [Clostridia bacterium]|nr:zinc ribbon domain-containing protein [Clostridia bacterium]
MEQIPNFRLDGGDMQYIVQNMYKLTANKLSPFYGMPAGGEKPAREALKLAEDEELKTLAQVLAQPGLKLSLRRGGATIPLEASALFIGQRPEAAGAVYLQEDGGLLSLTYFKNLKQYGEYFAAQNAVPVSLQPANTLKQELQLEDIVFTFNLTDCYRRAYLNNMLQDSYGPVDAVYEDEFVAVLEKSLKSPDIRWLLPSFLRLVPGLEKIGLEFSEKQVEMAEAMSLISRGANPGDNRPIYYLGGPGKYLGLEFSLFWQNAVGFEAVGLNEKSGETESLGQYYFAPTEEANHLFSITGSINDRFAASHQALTPEETAEQIQKILEGHCTGTTAPATQSGKTARCTASKTAAVAQPAEIQVAAAVPQAAKFCRNCGTKLAPATAFCGNCGTKV